MSEEAFSKLKAYLRRAGSRTQEALHEAIGHALLTVTAQDAQGWFQHCGYLPQQSRSQSENLFGISDASHYSHLSTHDPTV